MPSASSTRRCALRRVRSVRATSSAGLSSTAPATPSPLITASSVDVYDPAPRSEQQAGILRSIDEFRFGQKETSGQYPHAFVRASASFDGFE